MSVKTFFQASAPVTLKGDDAQLLKIMRDPEYQRLWQEQSRIIAEVDAVDKAALVQRWQAGDESALDEIKRLAMVVRNGDAPIKARFEALGGLPKNHYIVRGSDGQPQILRKTTTAGQIGRMARQVGAMAGVAFGAPMVMGALAPAAPAGAAGANAGALGAAGMGGGALPFASTIPITAGSAPLVAGAGGVTLGSVAAPVALSGGLGAAGTIGGATAPSVAASTPAAVAPAVGGGGGAAGGGGWASMLKGSTGDYVNAGASLIGAATSGQHGLNVANKDILKKLLAEYNRTQAYRTGNEKSFAGRLPTHMQANIAPLAPQGLQTLFGTKAQSPLLPDYSNIDYPRFPY